MKCLNCASSADGYSVVPGIGEYGEIRFYCDRCARNHRVKMRYWDGRDLDVGGYRENPDLGESFRTLVFSFHDVLRMRGEDLAAALSWVEDAELALALVGADAALIRKVAGALPPDRAKRVREMLESKENRGTRAATTPESAQDLVVSVIRRL
jgi:hypothetical protein